MITITNTMMIAIDIGIAITIAIAIISISPRPNAHTYAHNRFEVGSRFRWKIWVGDLLSPSSNCLPFLRNLRLQLSIPWRSDIVRSCHGGHAKDKVQTMILTDVMITANICCLRPATRYTPHATCCPPNSAYQTPPGSCLPVPSICNSASLWIKYTGANMGAYSQVRLAVSCLLRVYLAV